MPKIGRSLPKSLTEEEVESLLNAPAIADPLGHRDRTMLEVLYATGLRVSELVNLKYNQINTNQGVIRIMGKGNRERLIPLGEEAVRWLTDFVRAPRSEILLDGQPVASVSRPISPADAHPARPIVRSKSALKFCSTSRTPSSRAWR